MRNIGNRKHFAATALTLAGVLALGGNSSFAQAGSAATTVPDAQIEANVLKALAGAPQLTSEHITSTTVYGTVTLSGSVQSEDARQTAETLVSRAPGVKKVVDELTLETSSTTASTDGGQGTNPALQSDGTMAPPPPAQSQPGQSLSGSPHAPDPDAYAAQHGMDGQPQNGQPQDGQPNQPEASGGYAPPPPAYRPPYNGQQAQGYPAPQPPPYSNQQPPQGYPPNQQQPPYPQQGGYAGQQAPSPPPYGAQQAGLPITVPRGSLLRVRINEGLDSKHSQPGTPFDAVVLNDVVADGAVAIPRGASVQGKVTDVRSGGAIGGHGEIALQLTQVTLGGRTFPIVSDIWARNSSDKGGQTAANAVGLGATGAIIGAIAGGGGGALIGAGVGGLAGVGTSAASGSRQVLIPSEAILTFHLAQPAPMTTISQAEMDRLSYGVPAGASQQPQPRMMRRYPAPYYGPVYYPRPYPYPY